MLGGGGTLVTQSTDCWATVSRAVSSQLEAGPRLLRVWESFSLLGGTETLCYSDLGVGCKTRSRLLQFNSCRLFAINLEDISPKMYISHIISD